jgi:adenylate cyclase
MAEKKRKWRPGAIWRTAAIGLAMFTVLLVADLRHPSAVVLAELKASDLRMYARPGRKPTGKVVIAAIDDKSVAELGRWPWPRSIMGRLVTALTEYRSAVVGFDVIFSERDSADEQRESIAHRLAETGAPRRMIDESLGPENDQAFADALRSNGATVLAYPFKSHLFHSATRPSESGYVREIQAPAPFSYGLVLKAAGPAPQLLRADGYLPPIAILRHAARANAYIDVDSDADGTMRTELTVIKFHDRYCAPLFLALAGIYRHGAMLRLALNQYGVARVALGTQTIPVDEMGRMVVDFRGPEGTFPTYSVTDIIHRRVPPGALAGRIVLVGVTGHGLGDRIVTPVGADYPGVELHANAIDDLLQNTFITRSENTMGEELVAAAVLSIGVSVAAGALSALASALTALALCAGYFAYAQYLLTVDGVLVGVVFPLFAAVFVYLLLASYRYVTEGREKRHLRHAFEHYLHPHVIASLVDEPEGLRLGGERRHLSILFSDIVNFTARAERSEPEALVALLNTYMTVMTNLVLESEGVVDKLMGDGLMAFWGAPLEVANPARAAIDCALAMLEELERLRERDGRFGDLDIGIGIATGEAIVGNFGGERRFDYSVIGDTVNLASRLEGLTRRFGAHLIATRSTLDQAGNDYLAREIGLVRVKGKHEEVDVVEILGHRSAHDGRNCEEFAEALRLLRSGEIDRAAEHFSALAQANPNDRLVAMYLEKIARREMGESGLVVFEFETK